MVGPPLVAERRILYDLMHGLWSKHERRSWLVLRRSCAKEEEESDRILARAPLSASDWAYIFNNYLREIVTSLGRYALFQLVECRLPDPLNPHEVLDRTVWTTVNDPLRGGWADARQGI